MTHPAFFHAGSDSVRFWVEVDAEWVGATIGRRTLHHQFSPNTEVEDPLSTYQAHNEVIHAAVRARVIAGAIEPVMLRESHFSAEHPS